VTFISRFCWILKRKKYLEKRTIYLNTMARVQRSCIGCIGLRPALPFHWYFVATDLRGKTFAREVLDYWVCPSSADRTLQSLKTVQQTKRTLLYTYAVFRGTSDESRIIFLPERSSICHYPPKNSAMIVKTRARLLLVHPVLYILKTQKA